MKVSLKNNESGYFTLKDSIWLENQRIAGKILKKAHDLVKLAIKEGASTFDLDEIAEAYILDNDCVPTFKGYEGFPATTCISINNELVHGVPKKDRFLNKGDLVKIDLGVTFEGAIADSAQTHVVGDYNNARDKDLVDGCERALYKAIDYIKNNINNVTIGDVGWIIKKEAMEGGFTSVKGLMGHGLEYGFPHYFPSVMNFGERGKGIKLVPNMTICLEPIFIIGEERLKVGDDKWTISANGNGAHWEHTIFIHEDDVEIIT
jgi:methionyl aminopeptidase